MRPSEGAPGSDQHAAGAVGKAERNAVYIVLPAYNEETVVGEVVADLRRQWENVVVVDDCSEDATCEQARSAGASVLVHLVNRGQGASLQTGIEYALRRGAGYIVTFDSDGQHQSKEIPVLLEPVFSGEADIVLGSRFLGRAEDIPLARRILLKGAVVFTRLTSRVKTTDAHNGFRAFSRRAAQRMQLQMDRMAHASEILDQIRAMGLRYVERPVTIRYTDYSRAKGQRSVNAVNVVIEYFFGRLTK
jgi:glycosyltransferase involved in cell wall biosynthesis